MKNILAIVTTLVLSAGISSAQPTTLRDALVQGSPWIVDWTGGTRGQFNQTFIANPDGSLTAKSDETGPYEYIVRFSEDGRTAIWVSPHQRIIRITKDRDQITGTGGGLTLRYTSAKK